MSYLLDTGVAVRCVFPADPQYSAIRASVLRLVADGEELVVCTQVLGEAWSLCTRPQVNRGGYGLSTAAADELINDLIALATLMPEPADLWHEQHRSLVSCAVSGTQTHDCRLAAWCRLSGVQFLLTLNTKDFTRFGVQAVNPSSL